MIQPSRLALAGLMFLLTATAALSQSSPNMVRRVVIQDQLILRIPVRPRPMRPIEWKEKKGPKCLESRKIAGAMLSGPSSIDFVMRDRSRVRARMDSKCPALDFYGGFYLQPDDHRVCAKREVIRSRDGGTCAIERFRRLIPKDARKAIP